MITVPTTAMEASTALLSSWRRSSSGVLVSIWSQYTSSGSGGRSALILAPSKTGRRVFTSSMHRSVAASSLKVTNAKPVQCLCRLTRDRILASRSEICRLASASRAWMRCSCRSSRCSARSVETGASTGAPVSTIGTKPVLRGRPVQRGSAACSEGSRGKARRGRGESKFCSDGTRPSLPSSRVLSTSSNRLFRSRSAGPLGRERLGVRLRPQLKRLGEPNPAEETEAKPSEARAVESRRRQRKSCACSECSEVRSCSFSFARRMRSRTSSESESATTSCSEESSCSSHAATAEASVAVGGRPESMTVKSAGVHCSTRAACVSDSCCRRAKKRNQMSTPEMTNSSTASEVRSVSVLPRLSAVIRLSLSPMSCPSRLSSTGVSERSESRKKRYVQR
mmetsp:Transcript_29650/g.69902  ORF Transcript_29650/g.69902 Transcript_29650/m.69902 type:complete len:395 (-) Transcript_29650:672-1856(-)